MNFAKLLLFSLSFTSFSHTADHAPLDINMMINEASKDRHELAPFLFMLHRRNDLEGFSHLVRRTSIDLMCLGMAKFVKMLLEKEDQVYIDALVDSSTTGGVENFIRVIRDKVAKDFRHLARNSSHAEVVELLFKAYTDGNKLLFKTLVDEVYLQLSPRVKGLVDKLCLDGAHEYLNSLAFSLINETNVGLQNYISSKMIHV